MEKYADIKRFLGATGVLSQEELVTWGNNPLMIKKYLAYMNALSRRYFIYLSDERATRLLSQKTCFDRKAARHIVGVCRDYLTTRNYKRSGWLRVMKGYTIFSDVPKLEPCVNDLKNLMKFPLENNPPTCDSLVFFVPRVLDDFSSYDGMRAKKQLVALKKLRETLGLPDVFFQGFAPVSVLLGVMLAHIKRTGEKLPIGCNAVHTDTHARTKNHERILLGPFDDRGLDSRFWRDHAPYKCGLVGCYPIAVIPFN